MLTSRFSSILNLLTLIRCTLIWVELIPVAFGIPSGSIVGLCAFGLSVLAIIFNATVCLLETRAKKRTQTLPSAKPWVIALDIFFAACYILAFVFELITAVAIEWNTSEYYTLHGWNIFAAQAYAGVLVAWHYHIFFALVAIHSLRQRKSGVQAQKSPETRMESAEEKVPGTQDNTTTAHTEASPQ